MAYEDKILECADCGASFTFSASEQEFFASKGFTNEPKRCLRCRQEKKDQRNRGGWGNSGGGGYQRPRQMHSAECAECGAQTEVPFEPKEGRPVYCSDCYAKRKT